jgi:hypothetical protein
MALHRLLTSLSPGSAAVDRGVNLITKEKLNSARSQELLNAKGR